MSGDRKKIVKIAFLIIAILLFLTLGLYFCLYFISNCGDTITPASPDSGEQGTETVPLNGFEETIAQLDTSEKLLAFLNEHFEFTDRQGNVALTPEEFFESRKGNSWDFAAFSSYVLWKHKYEAGIIRYKYGDVINAVVVFRDADIPKTIIFASEGISAYAHGWSFEEMFQKEEERLGIKIDEYAISYWTDAGELWPEEWGKR